MRLPIDQRRLLPGLLTLCLLLLAGCGAVRPGLQPEALSLTVLYTNDEHGWMEGMTPQQGAAHLYGLWVQQEGFVPDGPFLVLSGGDNWTGPAVSTTVAGQSMVDVMNRMHYAASAVGNHEFDFGLEVLSQRIREADYPYLSANTRWHSTGAVPTDLGIQPYTVVEVNSLRVGIIGLTTTSTPQTTNPANVAALQFTDYAQALRLTVPAVRAEGVDLLFVIAHVCLEPLRQLAPLVADLDIQLMGGGHCNELAAERIDDMVLLGGGYHFTSYARAQFSYQPRQRESAIVDFSVRDNQAAMPDARIQAAVQGWQQQVDASLATVIGFNARELARRDPVLEQAVIDSWLLADSTADVAITNPGGIRAPLPAGEITIGSIVGIMPFDNTIVAINLSGAELRQALSNGTRPLVAGLVSVEGQWFESDGGAVLADDKAYRVLVNSFMYAGGDNYQGLATADPEGFDTGINYRQPFLDWISAQQTSAEQPLQLGNR